MLRPIVRVFVSSTWKDLQPERRAVERVINRLEATKFVGMEYFGSRDETTKQASLDDVDKSDIYIGILGARYGSGITEAEYVRAMDNDIPCLWYVMDEERLDGLIVDKPRKRKSLLNYISSNHLLSSFASPDDLAIKVSLDLHSWLNQNGLSVKGHQYLLQEYVNGVGTLPFDYAARIESFLNEYLGTPKSPVAFGGRDEELELLTKWLDDVGQSPYLLLAAPAGRGKSALLVQWSRLIQKREEIEVAFVPVSIRFRTNLSGVFFAALAARLAKLHGEEIQETASMTVEMWRGQITDYLQRPLPGGKRLLVIVDGADEAADWRAGPDLFPNNPPPGVKILVSARYRAGDVGASEWLCRLGWDRNKLGSAMKLERLTKPGLMQVLDSLGFPVAQLSKKVDVVKELFRLSERGDPLLIQFYVNDLWNKGIEVSRLKPEDLQSIDSGIDGYFKRWWLDQEELWEEKNENPMEKGSVEALLDLLAFAQGPLKTEDIIELLGVEFNLTSARKVTLSIKPISRFVTGDGKKHGYVLSHPRLGYYFQDEKTEAGKKEWEMRFVVWGRKVVDLLLCGNMSPKHVPAYLVQYYSNHLEQTEADLNTRMRLVNRVWCDAWEYFDGTNAGFLNDVSKAKLEARKINEQHFKNGMQSSFLGMELKCFLVESSLRSQINQFPPVLPPLLLKTKLWTRNQFYVFLDQLSDSGSKARLLSESIAFLEGEKYSQIKDIIVNLESKFHRVYCLTRMLTVFPSKRQEILKDAFENAIKIRNASDRSRALTWLIPKNDGEEKEKIIKKTLECSRLILREFDRAGILRIVGKNLDVEKNDEILEVVLREINSFKNESSQSYGLYGILSSLGEERKSKMIQQALDIALAVEDKYYRPKRIIELIPFLSGKQREEQLEQIVTSLDTTEDSFHDIDSLVNILPRLTKDEQTYVLKMAFKYVESIKEERNLSKDLIKIIPFLTDSQLERVLEIGKSIVNAQSRANVLIELARKTSDKTRSEITQLALRSSKLIEKDSSRADALGRLAPLLEEPERFQVLKLALESARYIEDEEYIALALKDLAQYLTDSDQVNALHLALKIAKNIWPESSRAVTLCKVAQDLEDVLRSEVFQLAIEIAGSRDDKISELLKITPYLPDSQQSEILKLVLEKANSNLSEYDHATTLIHVAGYMEGVTKTKLLESAKNLSESIKNDYSCGAVLIDIVKHFKGTKRSDILELSLNTITKVENDRSRAGLLSRLVQNLEREEQKRILPKFVEVLKLIDDERDYSDLVMHILPHLDENEHAEFKELAFEHVKSMKDEYNRSHAIKKLAPYIFGSQLRELFEIAKSLENESCRARALSSMLELLTETELVNTLEAARYMRRYGFEDVPLDLFMAFPNEISLYVYGNFCRLMDSDTIGRKHLLARILKLAPFVQTMGGKESLRQLLKGIEVVVKWWP